MATAPARCGRRPRPPGRSNLHRTGPHWLVRERWGAVVTTQTGRVLELELPLPSAELSPNARVHWTTRAAEARRYRAACGFVASAARGACGLPWPVVVVDLVFTYCDRRRLDADNAVASIKAGLDGLVDAGLIVNDSAKRLRLGAVEVRQVRHSKHPPSACPAGVRVILREVAE